MFNALLACHRFDGGIEKGEVSPSLQPPGGVFRYSLCVASNAGPATPRLTAEFATRN